MGLIISVRYSYLWSRWLSGNLKLSVSRIFPQLPPIIDFSFETPPRVEPETGKSESFIGFVSRAKG